MHELLDAIVHVCETLLIPFGRGNQPKKPWMMIVASLAAIAGVIALGIIIVSMIDSLAIFPPHA